MGWKRLARSLDAVDLRTRTFLLRVGRHRMRVTVAEDSGDALFDATESGQPLRGLVRVNGKLVSLHDASEK